MTARPVARAGARRHAAAARVAGVQAAGAGTRTVGTQTTAARTAGTSGAKAPVVVLTYARAGAARLRTLLSDQAGLACTTGTGVLPLCGQALATWQQAEGGRTSQLAVASVRTLATGMITAILLRAGRTRWCETAVAQSEGAEAFLRIYPEARFVCLHRSCPGMVGAVLRADRWGVSGPGFAPYVAAHPASTVAALAAYWTAHTERLLAFEREHSDVCLRVRYEDLVRGPAEVTGELAAFIGAEGRVPALSLPGLPDDAGDEARPDQDETVALPAGQLPGALRGDVERLHTALGYPPPTEP